MQVHDGISQYTCISIGEYTCVGIGEYTNDDINEYTYVGIGKYTSDEITDRAAEPRSSCRRGAVDVAKPLLLVMFNLHPGP
jgi:hypothetical protein